MANVECMNKIWNYNSLKKINLNIVGGDCWDDEIFKMMINGKKK